jgi:hypothetical protein
MSRQWLWHHTRTWISPHFHLTEGEVVVLIKLDSHISSTGGAGNCVNSRFRSCTTQVAALSPRDTVSWHQNFHWQQTLGTTTVAIPQFHLSHGVLALEIYLPPGIERLLGLGTSRFVPDLTIVAIVTVAGHDRLSTPKPGAALRRWLFGWHNGTQIIWSNGSEVEVHQTCYIHFF